MSGFPNITKSPSQKTKTLESILNGKIKKSNPFKTLPNQYKPNISFLRNEKSDSKQDQYYSSPLLTKSQLTDVEHLTRQSRNDFYSQMLSENPFQYNEYQNNDSEYNQKISEIQVNLIDIKNKERVKEFLHETTSFQNQISTHTQRPKRINVLTQRQDVIKLAQWLDYQMAKIIGCKTMIEQQQLREIETVFNLSLKELIREISLDCVEKSVLLEKIWNQYANYNVFLLKSIEDEKTTQENGYLTQIKSLHQTYLNSVNFLEEKLKQIDDEFNKLSIKFERKKFKLKTIRENFVNVTVQKKDMEEEITYLRTQKQDLIEAKELLQAQVEALTNENERLQLIIVSKQQELRTAKTKRYSQISLDSCASEQTSSHKFTSTEDFYLIMGLQKEIHTQTIKNEEDMQVSVLIQTDIKFIQHQASQTGVDEDYISRSQNSSFYSANMNKKNLSDHKELEEKLRISLQLNQDLQKARQLLLKDQENYQSKITSQEISLSQLQKEIERLQQELQSLLQSRQQKKRTVISLDESNGDQMSLGPVKELQKTPSNHQFDKLAFEKNNKLIEQKNQPDSNVTHTNSTNNLQGAKSPQSIQSSGQTGKSQLSTTQQNFQQNYQPDASGLKKDPQQQQKRGNHQRNLSDSNKPSSNSSQITSKQKVNSFNLKSKEEIIQLKQQQQYQQQQQLQQQNQQKQQTQQQGYSDNKQQQQSTTIQKSNTGTNLGTLDTIQQLEFNDKEQLNSQKIRNTLLSLNDNENDDGAQFESIIENQEDEAKYQAFKRSSTKKLSYKFNGSQHSQNTTVAIPQLQRKESYILPGPGNKSLRDKDMLYADVALEFIKSFSQTINLQHPEEIEQTMSLQNVFKLITQFYKERLERKQPIYVICYEFYMNTFGLKQIAENKLTQLCQAVVYYKDVPRVRLFARFLQIIDGIKEDDLEFYFSTLAVLDFQQKAENLITCTQNMDCVQVPYEKAMDQLSTLKEQIQEVEKQLRKNIQFVNGIGMVDVDQFFLEALQQFQLMRKIHKDNFKELFDAVDVNGDNRISIEEFQILFELLEGKDNLNIMKKQFITACRNQEGLIFYQFGMFCLTHELFKKDKQDLFLQYDKDQFLFLKQKWNEIRKQITARLKQSMSFTDYYQDLVRKLDYGLRNNVSHTWLLWRILDEQSKRLLIEQIVNSLIGVKLNYICQKIEL